MLKPISCIAPIAALAWLAGQCFSEAAELKVPPGFSVQLAATDPRIRFPMFATIDDRGRLLVAESSGLDLYKEISAGTRKCQVRLLDDRDGDGAYDSARVFADKLVFPMGLAWHDGKLYIADPPELITLEDTNGDDRADKRTVILSSFGAKDNGSLHGLVFGPDGLLYMTTGQPDGYRFELPDGKVFEGESGALIRCQPDGSNPEVLARGFENLVEVIFMPGSEIIGTDNWYQHPKAGIRDALLHLVEGGLYPMHPDTGTPYPITGEKLPALSLFPAVALSGLVRYEGSAFPAEWHGNLFSAQHNSRAIGRHILRRHGSTFVSEDSQFITTDDPDFHPSDVLQDADGTLLVLDTGSWYTDHCPTGKIRKSPAAGAIYRVRYIGRTVAKKIYGGQSVWNMNDADLRNAFRSPDADTVAGATAVFGLRRHFIPELVRLVTTSNPPVQVAAAQALARCGNASAVGPVISVLAQPVDRFLEHALVHALHHLASETVLGDLLAHENTRVQKAALLLLSQPPRPAQALNVEAVLARVQSADPDLRRTALNLLKSRREWATEASRVVKQWLASSTLSDDQRTGLLTLGGAFFNSPTTQKALRDAVSNVSSQMRRTALEIASKQPAPKEIGAWTPALRLALAAGSVDAARVAVSWRVHELSDDLRRLASDPQQPSSLRKESLRGVVGSFNPLPQSLCDFLLAELRNHDALTAGELLRNARLTDEQLIQALRSANALVPPASLLVAFHVSTSPERSRELLDVVKRIPGAGWNETEYDQFVKRLPSALREDAAALAKRFRPDVQEQHARMAKYEPLLRGGDADRGRAVFGSPKVGCATCHAIGNHDAKIGPDLTRIGAIRSGRDLLESILFPSSTFAQGYEPFLIEMKDGEEHSGTLIENDDQRVIVRNAAGNETSLSKSNVKEMRRALLSMMPSGLEQAMTEQEFRDLLAFLVGLK